MSTLANGPSHVLPAVCLHVLKRGNGLIDLGFAFLVLDDGEGLVNGCPPSSKESTEVLLHSLANV